MKKIPKPMMSVKSYLLIVLLICLMLIPLPVSPFGQTPAVDAAVQEGKTAMASTASASPYSDEFENTTLSPQWSWYNPNTVSYNLTAVPGYLQFVMPGDQSNAFPDVPRVLQTITGDFTIETKLYTYLLPISPQR